MKTSSVPCKASSLPTSNSGARGERVEPPPPHTLTGAEDQPVLRIEFLHRHFAVQVAADCGENFFQDLRVEKKRQPEVKPVASIAEVRPPTRGCFSMIASSGLALASNIADANPPGPAPMMRTRFAMALFQPTWLVPTNSVTGSELLAHARNCYAINLSTRSRE